MYTPAWKAPQGQHDENIPFARVASLIGHDRAVKVRDASLALYRRGAEVCERAGIILADTKFEFGVLPTGDVILIDEVLTPDSSRFWDAATYEPGRAQASYDKQFVRDWLTAQPWDRTAPGPALPAEVVAGHARSLRDRVRADHRRELRPLSRGGRDRRMSAYRFAVNVTPKPGILDPQGRAVERSLPHLGIEGVSAVRVGRRVELTVEAADEAAARATVERLASELLANPLIEAFAVDRLGAAVAGAPDERPHRRRRLPGLQPRHRRGQRAARRRCGARDPVARARPTSTGVAGILLPGGFAYGDYLRAGVIAQFSPVMRSVADFAGRGGPVLGICNGFQVLAEAGLVPGALLRNRGLRFVCRQVTLRAEQLDTPFTRELAGAGPLRMPVAHGEGCYFADDATLDALEADGQVLWRYVGADGDVARAGRRRATPTAPCAGSPACATPPATSPGLMPHPETAVEAILGSRRRPGDHPLAGRERARVRVHGRARGRGADPAGVA